MNIKVQEINEFSVFKIKGRVDTSNYSTLEEKLNEVFSKGKSNVIVDCTELDYISSSGLRIFLVGLKKSRGLGGDFIICNLNNNISEIFEISGFSRIFKIFPDLVSASENPV